MKVTKSYNELRVLDRAGMALYRTPGGGTYWANQPSFSHDFVVATPQDFLEASGFNSFEDELNEENDFELELEVE